MNPKQYRNSVSAIFISFLLVFNSCRNDNFYDTRRVIITDKDIYRPGDSIRLTMVVSPLKEKKVIRVYDNSKNMELSFSIINEAKNLYNSEWSSHTGSNLNDTTIRKIEISKEKPYTLSLMGNITESSDTVYISLPALNFKAAFQKSQLENGGKIRIHGLCNPIDPEPMASLEEFFETKDIQIEFD